MLNYVDMNLVNNPLVGFLWNCESDEDEVFDEVLASSMGRGFYTKNLIKLDLDLKNCESQPTKPSMIDPPQINLKPLFPHL